jgi:hypothetical protein
MDASDDESMDRDRGQLGPVPAEPPGGPAHAVRPLARPSRLAAAAGIAATLIAIGVGTAGLVKAPQPAPHAGPTLRPITVSSAPAASIPLSVPELFDLLRRPSDFGALSDPQRRVSCLTGLGYPASTRVLGARPIEVNGHSGVLLVLPGDQADAVVALAVAPNCSSAYTGLLADTTVRRP